MSMIRCDECDLIFDSDEDPACFVDTMSHVTPMRFRKPLPEVLCEGCRGQAVAAWEHAQRDMGDLS